MLNPAAKAAIAISLFTLGMRVPASAASEPSTATSTGPALYAIHCAGCHGVTGDGQGPAAYLVYPKPRSFIGATYRFRSTPSGALPLDEDLARTIRVGIPGTAMPAFGGFLSPEQIDGLVRVVKGFSPRFKSTPPVKGIDIPPRPLRTEELVAQGRTVYQEMGCKSCHGPDGRGDGPAAAGLKDSDGYAIPAKDFTRGPYKSGNRPEDIYRAFVTGLDGTPMPSFADLFRPQSGTSKFADPGWALVYYIQSLQPPAAGRGEGAGARIKVAPLADATLSDSTLFEDPTSPAWQNQPETEVTLRPLWTRNEYPQTVSVRGVQSHGRIAIRLEWADPTFDTSAVGTNDFPDKAAISLPLSSDPPFIGMGSRSPKPHDMSGMVNIWCWRADRDHQARTGHFLDIQDKYPLVENDWYPFKRRWRVGEREDPSHDDVTDFNPTYLTGLGAGNPVSDPFVKRGTITEYDAMEFGTLTPQPAVEQNVTGTGTWANGHWSVIFVRDLYTGGDGDALLTQRMRIPVGFAIWDGKVQDRAGKKSVSNWHWLVLENKEAGE